MAKIVINVCYGGFGLSEFGMERYSELKGLNVDTDNYNYWYFTDPEQGDKRLYDSSIKRDDPFLIQVVEELGELADGESGELHIVEVPDDLNWFIDEYAGMEHVAESHRTWS